MPIGPVVQLGRLYTTNNTAGKIGSVRRESSFGSNCARSSNSISAGGTGVGTSGSVAKPEEDAVQWAVEGVGPWHLQRLPLEPKPLLGTRKRERERKREKKK